MKKKGWSDEEGWNAIRDGAIFCSPRCGHRCTFAAYKSAHAAGKAQVARLGVGWSYRVWENMGWHVSIGLPGVEVHGTTYPTRGVLFEKPYTAFFFGGSWTENGNTPEAAVKSGIRTAESKAGELHRFLEAAALWRART